eukprot:3307575-Prymnesium_polylepis.1
MSRPRPGGGECSAGCGATHSSNWFKKAPNKICRACYRRATQRVGTHQRGPRRSSPTSVTAEMASIVNTLESWQDLEADVKTVVKILGCRKYSPTLPPYRRRDCDPTRYVDPADLRAELIEDELDLEFLIYGLFVRPDRPDGAFLSKRWVRLDDLLEHGGYGNMKVKIDEYEASKATRMQATIEA